jgi:hypothetical protein
MSIQSIPRFVHVGFSFKSGTPPPAKELGKIFDSFEDWLRYDLHCWILYTSTPLDELRDRIRQSPAISESDSFFLCEFNPTKYSGYQQPDVWEWLHKKRPPRYTYSR